MLAQGLAYWQRLRGDRTMPARRDIDPVDIPGLLPYVLLVDVDDEPVAFRYRLVGSIIVSRSVRDYTGMNMTDLPAQRPPSRLWDLYLRSVTERQPVAMLIPRLGHEEDPAYSVSILAAPLSSDGTVVDMLFGIVDFSRLRDEVLSKPVM